MAIANGDQILASHHWGTGTSFPGSPVAGQHYYRSDLGLYYTYNGSAWALLGASVDGWISPTTTIPTRSVSDDPEYEIVFAGEDLTGTLYPGMKLKFTQDGTVRYFFITKVTLDGSDTDVRLYGGTDYDVGDTASLVISDVYYSREKAPAGFPMDPNKWSVEITDSSDYNVAATSGTWYNLGSLSIDVPIGIWKVTFRGCLRLNDNRQLQMTLSTANNTQSDEDLSSPADYCPANRTIGCQQTDKEIEITTKDTLYFNERFEGGGSDTLYLYGSSYTPSLVRLTISYL